MISDATLRFRGVTRAIVVLAAAASVLCAFGCGGAVETPAVDADELPLPLPVDATASPERIITFAPHITETVFALGKGALVVAVSDFCDFPPAVEDLDRVGGWHNPDLEKVTRLSPTLVIVQGEHAKVTQLARRRDFELLRLDMDSLDTIREGIRTVGERLDCSEAAETLIAEFDAGLDAVRAAVASRSRVPVLILTGRQLRDMTRFHTVGGASFISELVDVAGGANIYADASRPYIEASKETVVMRAPEAVIEVHAGQELPEDIRAQYIADWRQLPSLPAVQSGRIYLVTDSHALRPGPRAPEIAAGIARLLHPDAEPELEDHGRTP